MVTAACADHTFLLKDEHELQKCGHNLKSQRTSNESDPHSTLFETGN